MTASGRILLTLGGTAVVAAAVSLLVALPVYRTMKVDRAVTAERRDKLVRLQEVTRRITDLQQEVTRLEGALKFFDSRLPAQTELDVILREVWTIAESKSLVPRSVRTKKAEAGPRCNSQPISIAFEGSFQSFYEFLLGLERLPRITKVREMHLQKSMANEGQVLVDMTMDIFYEK